MLFLYLNDKSKKAETWIPPNDITNVKVLEEKIQIK